MADRKYDERGRGYERDREQDRYGSRDYAERSYGSRSEDDDRGFFERAGDEIRSWFSPDEDRAYERSGSRYGDEDKTRQSGFGSRAERDFGRGSFFDRDRESDRSYGRSSRPGISAERDFGRSTSAGYGQSARQSGYRGQPGGYQGDWSSGRERFGTSSRSGQRQDRDEDRAPTGYLMYEEISGTLGGFGNQRFGSSQDDHYRSWRDRQMQQLDRDYQDYCRERERQFHQDFDSWRRDRQGQPRSQESISDQSKGASVTGSTSGGMSAGSVTGTDADSQQSSGMSSTAGTGGSAIGGSSGSAASETASSKSQSEPSESGGSTRSGRGRR